ncbi:hypothetical protein [Chryseobacterium sp. EO14]|uniref:hypothetical protein n=1 Tax=Chryseobacterium sp. EO14 TaxID=2950551 RepID=UPI00210E985E|nr:hypothetical protein [Chryseobacterium sp. EO14]MCQ4139219.1 hypothetical protein [Chryseobacterium sp. EO14]
MKRVSVSYRLEEKYVELLKKIAENQERSQTSVLQILIREKAEEMGIKVDELKK